MAQRKVKLSRNHEYIIQEADGQPGFIGKKCRLVLASEGQEAETVAGFILDLQAYMLTGPYKGQVVELPPVKLKFSTGDPNCRCLAYKFPHARGLGACKAEAQPTEAPKGLSVEDIFTREAS